MLSPHCHKKKDSTHPTAHLTMADTSCKLPATHILQNSFSPAFPHALVAVVERYHQKVTRRMSKNKQAKKSKVKPFVKQVNCT